MSSEVNGVNVSADNVFVCIKITSWVRVTRPHQVTAPTTLKMPPLWTRKKGQPFKMFIYDMQEHSHEHFRTCANLLMICQRKRRRETFTAKNQEVSSLKQLRSLIHHKILPEPRWSFRHAQRSCVFPFRCGNSRTVADFKLTPLISPSPMTEPNTNAHDLPLNDGLKA